VGVEVVYGLSLHIFVIVTGDGIPGRGLLCVIIFFWKSHGIFWEFGSRDNGGIGMAECSVVGIFANASVSFFLSLAFFYVVSFS
jgi:hypothetical protein